MVERLYGVVIEIASHLTCSNGGVIQDIWNCSNKKVYNYYVKFED